MRPRQDDAGYWAAHMRVRRTWGSASQYTCPCGSPARNWAYQHGDPDERQHGITPYSLDPAYYRAMCMTCHRAVDARTHCPHGHEFTPENTKIERNGRRCRTCTRARDRERSKRRYARVAGNT